MIRRLRVPKRSKIWVARLISAPWVGRVLERTFRGYIPHHGISLDVRRLALPPALVARVFWRLYEDDEISFVRRYLRSTAHTIELGTSRGVVTSHLLTLLGEAGTLVTVEADPQLCEVVEAAFAGPISRGTLHCHRAAITGGGALRERFYSGETSDTGTTMSQGPESVDVPAITLAALKDRHDISEYDLVSDIEGAEAHFIVGDDKAALSGCQRLVIELHSTRIAGTSYSVEDLLDALLSFHGFRLLDRRGPVVALSRVIGPEEGSGGESGTRDRL